MCIRDSVTCGYFFKPSANLSISGFSTKLPVGLFGLIKINYLVLSVIKDRILSALNFRFSSSVKSYGTDVEPV